MGMAQGQSIPHLILNSLLFFQKERNTSKSSLVNINPKLYSLN